MAPLRSTESASSHARLPWMAPAPQAAAQPVETLAARPVAVIADDFEPGASRRILSRRQRAVSGASAAVSDSDSLSVDNSDIVSEAVCDFVNDVVRDVMSDMVSKVASTDAPACAAPSSMPVGATVAMGSDNTAGESKIIFLDTATIASDVVSEVATAFVSDVISTTVRNAVDSIVSSVPAVVPAVISSDIVRDIADGMVKNLVGDIISGAVNSVVSEIVDLNASVNTPTSSGHVDASAFVGGVFSIAVDNAASQIDSLVSIDTTRDAADGVTDTESNIISSTVSVVASNIADENLCAVATDHGVCKSDIETSNYTPITSATNLINYMVEDVVSDFFSDFFGTSSGAGSITSANSSIASSPKSTGGDIVNAENCSAISPSVASSPIVNVSVCATVSKSSGAIELEIPLFICPQADSEHDINSKTSDDARESVLQWLTDDSVVDQVLAGCPDSNADWTVTRDNLLGRRTGAGSTPASATRQAMDHVRELMERCAESGESLALVLAKAFVQQAADTHSLLDDIAFTTERLTSELRSTEVVLRTYRDVGMRNAAKIDRLEAELQRLQSKSPPPQQSAQRQYPQHQKVDHAQASKRQNKTDGLDGRVLKMNSVLSESSKVAATADSRRQARDARLNAMPATLFTSVDGPAGYLRRLKSGASDGSSPSSPPAPASRSMTSTALVVSATSSKRSQKPLQEPMHEPVDEEGQETKPTKEEHLTIVGEPVRPTLPVSSAPAKIIQLPRCTVSRGDASAVSERSQGPQKQKQKLAQQQSAAYCSAPKTSATESTTKPLQPSRIPRRTIAASAPTHPLAPKTRADAATPQQANLKTNAAGGVTKQLQPSRIPGRTTGTPTSIRLQTLKTSAADTAITTATLQQPSRIPRRAAGATVAARSLDFKTNTVEAAKPHQQPSRIPAPSAVRPLTSKTRDSGAASPQPSLIPRRTTGAPASARPQVSRTARR